MGSCPDTDIDPFFFLFPRFYLSKSPYYLLRHGIPINHGEIHRFCQLRLSSEIVQAFRG